MNVSQEIVSSPPGCLTGTSYKTCEKLNSSSPPLPSPVLAHPTCSCPYISSPSEWQGSLTIYFSNFEISVTSSLLPSPSLPLWIYHHILLVLLLSPFVLCIPVDGRSSACSPGLSWHHPDSCPSPRLSSLTHPLNHSNINVNLTVM